MRQLILNVSLLFIASLSNAQEAPKGTIAYIRPLNMTIFTSSDARIIKLDHGYNAEVWDANRGFSVAKMKQVSRYFPTTGFKGAEFDIIGSGSDQSIYRCTTKSSWIELSNNSDNDLGHNCHVTFTTNTKPTTPTTVDMEQKINKKWVKIDSYTVYAPKKWAIGVRESMQYADTDLDKATKFPALDACRQIGPNADYGTTTWQQGAGQNPEDKAFRQKYMYRRDELTNSPYADPVAHPEGNSDYNFAPNLSIRDIDSTFSGEWGSLKVYEESSFYHSWNWSVEANSNSKQHFVALSGYTGRDDPDHDLGVICRGE